MSRARALLALAVASAAACSDAPPKVGEWQQGDGFRWRALDVRDAAPSAAVARAGFAAISSSHSGVTHRNDVDDAHALANRDLLIGAGAATGDIDGDGYPDLFLASVEKPAALYRNLGGFRFEDVTASSGVRLDSLSTGGAFADVDGDGDLDLVSGSHGGPVSLWLNDGHGRFTDATATSGLTGGNAATTLTLADVDGDGDLDLYVATYKVRSALDVYPPQARAFDQTVMQVGERRFAVRPEWAKEYRIEDRPDLGGIVRSQRAEPDLFFVNEGGGRFTRVPISGPRFRDEDGKPLAAEPDFFTLAARFYDVNGDGAPDLYVCNDFEDPDQFWMNDGAGNFRLAPRWALSATSNTCMSVDFGDVDRDGTVDIFTADMLSPTRAARQRAIPTHTPLPKTIGGTGARAQWMRNMLQVNRGDGSWAQLADFAGVAASDWTWGSAFLDVDLDGYEDLVAVNGHRWDIRDADTFDRIRNSFPRVAWDKEQGEFPRLATRNAAFRNRGDLTFAAMPNGWGLGETDAISHGLALADLDLDGDLDAVVTRLDAPAQVYRNEANAPRVAVRVAGGGIGAHVTLHAPGLPVQAREVTAGGYYLSGSEPLLTFAAVDTGMAITVRWRDGRVREIGDVRANRLYEVNGDGATVPPTPNPAATTQLAPLFTDASAALGGQSHHETPYDDFRRQPLLPERMSQLGPAVAWIDADRDGREDLVVGSGRGGTVSLLLNQGARFTARSGATASGDVGGIVPLPDGKGGERIAVAQSNYEMGSLDSALAVPGVLALDARTAARAAVLVPGDTASVGALAAADVNGDGWLDLFVGTRVIGGSWPLPRASRLFLGKPDGSYARDVTNDAALGALGLVTGAVLADVTGDSRPDLVAASEFGPVRVLVNEGGRFRDVTAALGIDGIRSRWNGVNVGDFDGDGRLDIVAASRGRNLPVGASAQRPHVLYAGRFGTSSLGLVFARADSGGRGEMPLESFSRLGIAFPKLRTRVKDFTEFSGLSVDALFGEDAQGAIRVGATTYDHTLFLNRGARFEARPLPAMAQWAPSQGVSVADFDGDGKEDLFLSQNLHPTEISAMRLDAGVGLVLLGDGAGGFRALGVRESGVAIRGDMRGSAVADYDRDGRPDLAVGVNGSPTVLLRNVTGRVGVRVRVVGTAGNPRGVGSLLRVETAAGLGPARAVVAGSGLWSTDGSVLVLALPEGARGLVIRGPGGQEQRIPMRADQSEMEAKVP